MRSSLVLLILTAAIAGCAATGVRVSPEQVAAFKPGEATESLVVQQLGAPTSRMRLGDGSVILIYSYADYRMRPASLIPVVGAFVGGGDMSSSAVSLRFGRDGKLIDTSSYTTATGTAVGISAGDVKPKTLDQPRQ